MTAARSLFAVAALAWTSSCYLLAGYGDFDFDAAAAGGQGGTSEGGGGTGSGGGPACTAPSDCPGEDTTCSQRSCDAGSCGVVLAAAGTECTEQGGGYCDGETSCVPCLANTHCGELGYCIGHGCNVAAWAKPAGGSGEQWLTDLVVDGEGNIVVVGFFDDKLDLGCGAKAAQGKDGFVAKLSGTNGSCLWMKQFGDGEDQRVEAVAIDGQGALWITGSFAGSMNLDKPLANSSGYRNVFVARLTSAGAWSGSTHFPGAGTAQGSTIVPLGGDIVVGGEFAGTLELGSTLASTSGSDDDIFVARLSAAGSVIWSHDYGDAFDQHLPAVAVDDSERIFLAGTFSGGIDFGGGAFDAPADPNIFLAQLDGNGVHQWSSAFGDAKGQYLTSLAVDGAGCVIGGQLGGSVDFGGGPVTAADTGAAFVAAFDSDGKHRFSGSYGDPNGNDSVEGVATDSADNVLMVGHYSQTLTVGAEKMTAKTDSVALFAAALTDSGVPVWAVGLSSAAASIFPSAMAVDAGGRVVVGGMFDNDIDLGTGVMFYEGTGVGLDRNVFVAVFPQ